MRLLLLEDDVTLGEGLRDFLAAEGHEVDWFTRLADVGALDGPPYDALLVDWQLPDGSGVDWLRALRARGELTPVLLLTARDRIADRIAGLDSGADDYLVKPFAPEELVARVRAVHRRQAAPAGARLVVGAVQIDLDARTASLDGRRADLTAREWTLLHALATRAGRVVHKVDLEGMVFGPGGDIASNALEVHVSALRRKLGRDIIQTVRGAGYRLAPAAPR